QSTQDAHEFLDDNHEMLAPTSAHLYLTIGLPGSGKSTWLADNLRDARIVSSDLKRVELFGDINNQSDNAYVFKCCFDDIENALKAGEKVALDATNTRLNQRAAFLHLARRLHAHTTILLF